MNRHKIIGQNIKARRRALGLIQQDLADHLHVSRQQIGAIEQGKAFLDFAEAPAIAAALSLDDPLILLEEDVFIRTPKRTIDIGVADSE